MIPDYPDYIEPELLKWLDGQKTVTDLVGKRIYPQRAAQGASMPYATYARIACEPERTVRGRSNAWHVRLMFFFWASTQEKARQMASVFRCMEPVEPDDDQELSDVSTGFVGLRGGTPGDEAFKVQAVQVENDADNYSPPNDASGRGDYGCSFEVDLRFIASKT